jgi:hypothetical protein
MPRLNQEPSTAFILGAGFSNCSGLPTQAKFSELMLSDKFDDQIDIMITQIIKDFLTKVFGWQERKELPSLEDIFTCIDLSASTGHNLGFYYAPKHLRSLRRMLIYRIFSVLNIHFDYSGDIRKLLEAFHISTNSVSRCNFIVLNWDIVLEKHLKALDSGIRINYCTPCYDWSHPNLLSASDGVPVCKMHGSSNWVYCDNCKSMFYNLDEKLSLRLKAGLEMSDFEHFNINLSGGQFNSMIDGSFEEGKCKLCGNRLSTHIATFSYRKSFRTPSYSSIWYHAERLLSESDHWVFIGYSLPEADYEFKHLLKSAQLRKSDQDSISRKRIEVVVKDPKTCKKFKTFFGPDTIYKCHNKGLAEYVSKLNPII